MTAQDLKNSILQLAVRGKLVPQNSADESASELLKCIRAEKRRLISDGKIAIKKCHAANKISDDDIPYDLPESWQWVRFSDIAMFYPGKTPQRQKTKYWANGKHPWISIADMAPDGIITSTEETISDSAFNDCFGGNASPKGTMIMSFKLTIGKVSLLGIDAVHNEAIISIFPYAVGVAETIIKSYLFKILPMIAITGDFKNAIKGKTLNATSISNLLIPLPPLAEQKRIVSKIEELLPCIAEYDVAEKRMTELNDKFPGKIRKSILQQAVQGKLTERDPDDEPAFELLKRIRAEKVRLIAGGKIQEEKPLLPIKSNEIPFDIPETWKWEKVGNIFKIIRGSSPRPKGSPLYWATKKTEFHWVTIKDISDNTVDGKLYQTHEYLTKAGAALSTYVAKGELIIAVSGSTTGKHCILGINGYIYDGLAAVINQTRIISSQYILLFFDWVYERLNSQKTGSAFPNINTNILKNTLIPIPPLAEQKRIVTRVKELLAVCDGLK